MTFDVAQGIAVLERTPATLHAMLHELDPAWLDATEGAETWSPDVVVGHFAHADRAHSGPARPAHRFSTCEPPSSAVRSFRTLPRESGQVVVRHPRRVRANGCREPRDARGLAVDGHRPCTEGEHPEVGTVTLRQLLATWVVHDLGQIAQIVRVMAQQYRGAIGVWRAYLPIVDR